MDSYTLISDSVGCVAPIIANQVQMFHTGLGTGGQLYTSI